MATAATIGLVAFICTSCNECTPPAGAGAEDHFTQQGDRDCRGAFAHFPGIDYWQGNTNSTARGGGPAFDRNGTYNAFQFNDEAVQIISMHDPAQSSLFLYLLRATSGWMAPLDVLVELLLFAFACFH